MPDEPETTGRQRFVEAGEPHRFQPGNPGRPKGSKNKLGEAFVHALCEDFEKNGVDAIEIARRTDPVQYLKVIAAVIPKEVVHKVEDFSELSDADLERELRDAADALREVREADRRAKAEGLPRSLPN